MTGGAASNQTQCGTGERLIEWIQLILGCILLITVKSRFAPASENCEEAQLSTVAYIAGLYIGSVPVDEEGKAMMRRYAPHGRAAPVWTVFQESGRTFSEACSAFDVRMTPKLLNDVCL